MSVLAHQGAWTFEELVDLPDTGERYEVVDGNLIVTPPPSHLHQAVSYALAKLIELTCPADWQVQLAFAIKLGTDGRIPDVVVIRADAPLTGQSPYPVGPESFGMVVEVVSPRTRKTDRFLKPAEYAEAGIPLYWRVELEPELEIHAYELRDGAYQPVQGSVPVPWGSISLDLATLLA
ncbi:MAG: hypothetical protein JWN31_2065 [Frankiales bacterium]|nr:hypothetical protein [Frankiales bacterium]